MKGDLCLGWACNGSERCMDIYCVIAHSPCQIGTYTVYVQLQL